ncbi:MAG: HupE/UreJ family protein [Chromatiales bacterium]|nr:HupE/UreJ family protein [Chromatiales bacterium]
MKHRAAALAAAFYAGPAAAHLGFAANDLYSGLLHPLLHLSTLLPLVALVLWLSQREPRELTRTAPALLGGTGVGIVAALSELPVAILSALLLPLALALGLLLASRARLASFIAITLAAFVGVGEGVANVEPVRAQIASPMLYGSGLLLVMGLAVLHPAALLAGRRQAWIVVGTRIAGSWIAAAALLVLVLEWSGRLPAASG